jgi:hypothetical protein
MSRRSCAAVAYYCCCWLWLCSWRMLLALAVPSSEAWQASPRSIAVVRRRSSSSPLPRSARSSWTAGSSASAPSFLLPRRAAAAAAAVEDADESFSNNKKAKRSRPPPPTGYSFVEGDAYGSASAEVEALGGDPFFLPDDSNFTSGGAEQEMGESSPVDAAFAAAAAAVAARKDASGDAFRSGTNVAVENTEPTTTVAQQPWEWDGEVDEDAYFDEQ